MAIDFASELNAEQLAVVGAPDGMNVVVAGAGSGKTRALTYRVAWLLERGVGAHNILLLTFTNRAAKEMLHRVETLVGNLPGGPVWGGTFHHVGNRCLRDDGHCIGLPPSFSILDREDAQRLVGACLNDLGVRKRHPKFPGRGALLGLFGLAKNTLQTLADILADQPSLFHQCQSDILQVQAEYETRKADQGVLDFDDLLFRFWELLRDHEPVRERLARRFQHILVDEFQDTNAVQGAIIEQLASHHGNLTVVGDDAQAIYRFRGASFENVLDFHRRHPQAHLFKLQTNYRSRPEILALANASIANNQRRLPKELLAVRPTCGKPFLAICPDQLAQTRYIGESIERLLHAGVPVHEIAVIYRSHYHSFQIQMELRARNIAFRTRGGLRFFEQAHVKDILAFLRIVQNGCDSSAWLRVLPQLPRVGERTAERFWSTIAHDPNPLAAALEERADAALPPGARPGFQILQKVLAQALSCDTPAAMLETVLHGYYADYLTAEYDKARGRLDDIHGVVDFARGYEKLDEFLSEVALVGESDIGEAAKEYLRDDDAVVLSTIHQAKGLEWSVVFIPWLTEGRFPTWNAGESVEETEEERRVFHVATTRAKDELHLVVPMSAPDSRGFAKPTLPSLFVSEVSSALFELRALGPTSGGFAGTPRPAGPRQAPAHLRPAHADDPEYHYTDTPF